MIPTTSSFIISAGRTTATATRRTRTTVAASAFVKSTQTTTSRTTRRPSAFPTTVTTRAVSSLSSSNNLLATRTRATIPQQQQQLSHHRRGFFTQIMNMISGNSGDESSSDVVTPESLVESLKEYHHDNNDNDDKDDKQLVGNCVGDAAFALYEADAVCFDVDSTVINEEGIDVLAEFLGKGEEVATLTAAAMEGGMKFQDALTARLDLLQPSKSQILDCLQKHPLELTPGVDTFISTLQAKGVDVFLVSGGFRIMIEPVAKMLNINPKTNVYANTILFNEEDGDDEHSKSMCGTTYGGFDAKEPTSQDMGKPKAIQLIMDNHFHHRVVMIGDGATDAQARPPASAFIGFGGVVEREAVKEQADWFVTSFDELTAIIEMRKDPTPPRTE